MNAPQNIGRYRIVAPLAVGGMAELFLARLAGPGGFQRTVVLKRVLPELAEREEFRAMFLDEARIVAGLRHSNVVQVQELGQDGDTLFLVMEYLEGEPLNVVGRRSARKEEFKLDYGLCAHIVAEVAAGLHFAHEFVDDRGVKQNLVHRDVSPQNIFVTYDGSVKILDFGIALAADRASKTRTGQIKGKYAYMAPEQFRSEKLDRRTDVFALGVVLYEMCSGKRLFSRPNVVEMITAILESPVEPPSVVCPDIPEALERVILKALEKNRDERYQTCAEMRRDLLGVIQQLQAAAMAEERLSHIMRGLFADRIQAKRELLKQVQAGAAVPDVLGVHLSPEAEPARSTEYPVSGNARTAGDLEFGSSLPQVGSDVKRRLPISVVATAVLVSVAMGGLFGFRGEETPSRAMQGRASAGAFTAVASASAPTQPSAAASPEPVAVERTVRLFVDTTPAGALVKLGGTPLGISPLELTTERTDKAVALQIELEGYEMVTKEITLTMAQRIALVLPVKAPTMSRIDATPRPRTARSAARPAQPAQPAHAADNAGFFPFE